MSGDFYITLQSAGCVIKRLQVQTKYEFKVYRKYDYQEGGTSISSLSNLNSPAAFITGLTGSPFVQSREYSYGRGCVVFRSSS